MKWKTYLSVCIIFSSCSDLIDEEPPYSPINLTAYYTHSRDLPRVHLSWSKPDDDDINEYHVFRSVDGGVSYDSLGKVSRNKTMFDDTSFIWLQDHYYSVRAVDRANNIGSFSDSIHIYCYNPGGNWEIDGFDSLFLCIDPVRYTTPEIFRLIFDDSLESLGDTVKIMDLTEMILDSNSWRGNGLMHFSYLVLEESEDGSGVDTVTYLNAIPSEWCTIDVSGSNDSETSTGFITFDSETYSSIMMNYNLTSCGGSQLIP